MVNGHGDSDGPGALRAMENGILDLVESFIRYYLLPDVDAAAVDVNLMLGASILKGKAHEDTFSIQPTVLEGTGRAKFERINRSNYAKCLPVVPSNTLLKPTRLLSFSR